MRTLHNLTAALLLALAGFLGASQADAQQSVNPCYFIPGPFGGNAGPNCDPTTAANPLPVTTQAPGLGTGAAGYPNGATPVGNTGTGTTGGVTVNLPAAAGQFGYLAGFTVCPGSATTAITLTITLNNVNGIGGGTWTVGAPATAAGVTGTCLTQTFTPPVRTSVVNQNASLVVGALGAGGVNQTAVVWGYTQ